MHRGRASYDRARQLDVVAVERACSPTPSAPAVEVGVTITYAAVGDGRAHLSCGMVAVDSVCPKCGSSGRLSDHVERRVTDLPIPTLGTRPAPTSESSTR